VLRAMQVPYVSALGAIRFSFSHENRAEDAGRVLEVLPQLVMRAREVSGFSQAPASSATA
jgi:cysteine desulfurase